MRTTITTIAAALALTALTACTDVQDDAIERGVESEPAMETPQTEPWDTLHPTVPPAPGVEEPGAGEPRTPAVPPGSDDPAGTTDGTPGGTTDGTTGTTGAGGAPGARVA